MSSVHLSLLNFIGKNIINLTTKILRSAADLIRNKCDSAPDPSKAQIYLRFTPPIQSVTTFGDHQSCVCVCSIRLLPWDGSLLFQNRNRRDIPNTTLL